MLVWGIAISRSWSWTNIRDCKLKLTGKLIVKVEPRPTSVSTCSWPFSWRIKFRTISNPIPRPEISLTWAAVEKSGSKIQLRISPGGKSLIDLLAGQIPLSTARWYTFSILIPPPSSLIVIINWFCRSWAVNKIVAVSGFPLAKRSYFDSMPWSKALFNKWVRGVCSCSSKIWSTGTFLPSILSSTGLSKRWLNPLIWGTNRFAKRSKGTKRESVIWE